jgi:predicted regulator of Ras-like GTPase activity (Roadblock/LC7/MglB family)
VQPPLPPDKAAQPTPNQTPPQGQQGQASQTGQTGHAGQASPSKNGNSGSRPISSLVVSELDSKRIGEQLDRLLRDAGVVTALLLDKAGEVIALRGETPSEDVTNLGALLAGTFATSREIARQLNETQFRSLFQQGMKQNTLTELVGEVWLVVVMFDKSTHVGLVKDVCRQVTPQLEAVLLQVQRQSRIVSGLNPAFRTSVEDTIDLLFKD